MQCKFIYQKVSLVSRITQNLFFHLLLLNKNEISTLRLAIDSKRKKRGLWYSNNLIAPLLIIYSPLIFYFASRDFGVISFDKNFFDLSVTGAITLLGINVMRVSLAFVNERIDESKIPESIRKSTVEDVESLKSKLRHWINLMTIIGTLLFCIQAAGFIKSDSSKTIYYVVIIFISALISITFSRFVTIVQSNFFDDENLIKSWIDALGKKSETSHETLNEAILKEGL
ncbi:MAG: hypothetical protein WA004_14130 [Saprospiraceae bacterium]